ncbi:UDP-4-amino-4-deoxy-L-arabinose--oxoglutarate aminotransferase [Pseudobythopirellula maris]|uniref:UDP-4-amino-4-deoxy-L-arabinose--oxoglutarate aminotransferase n=1 Tax=Pseudobythopirellula maris TaxID=2527991 RepID=A0A5C5ZIN1_9BACT|nr:DegT/DnrJ/EryC1/StrS aminotransferase family protein [Pseudobythopirellula maris]TWT87096.1 UDP-4-amino-4-deoxy-L-arabinose--oxoglutarate aminotransferase [Pseudobythopirellula maris]
MQSHLHQPWPVCDEEQQEAALRVLRSGKLNYWTGEEGKLFEREYAQSLGRHHAITLANGTLALELALHAFGVGPGDEVVVPARTFIATASAVVARGAKPVVADVDYDSQNVTAETIEAVLTTRTKAVIPVHLAGWPCEMGPILDLAEQRGLIVIEDCAQAHGAELNGRPVGSFGHAAAFSFCQDKILTTAGEGGMLVLDDEAAWKRAWSFKDHGKGYDAVFNRDHPPGFRWLHESFGSNYRMTEVQSAIGRVALRRLPEWLETRRRNAKAIDRILSEAPSLRVPVPPAGVSHAHYKHYVFVRPERLLKGWDRDRVMDEINARGVPCFSGSCSEIYLEKAFPSEWRPRHRLPVAKELGETSLMLLVDPTHTAEECGNFARTVYSVIDEASSRQRIAA